MYFRLAIIILRVEIFRLEASIVFEGYLLTLSQFGGCRLVIYQDA